ncbi:hypothetical protein PG987_006547 [Apiospora arundinis]
MALTASVAAQRYTVARAVAEFDALPCDADACAVTDTFDLYWDVVARDVLDDLVRDVVGFDIVEVEVVGCDDVELIVVDWEETEPAGTDQASVDREQRDRTNLHVEGWVVLDDMITLREEVYIEASDELLLGHITRWGVAHGESLDALLELFLADVEDGNLERIEMEVAAHIE